MNPEMISSAEFPEDLRKLGILPASELVELYFLLPEEQQQEINARADALRHSPTGMDPAEATISAIQERYLADLQS